MEVYMWILSIQRDGLLFNYFSRVPSHTQKTFQIRIHKLNEFWWYLVDEVMYIFLLLFQLVIEVKARFLLAGSINGWIQHSSIFELFYGYWKAMTRAVTPLLLKRCSNNSFFWTIPWDSSMTLTPPVISMNL